MSEYYLPCLGPRWDCNNTARYENYLPCDDIKYGPREVCAAM